jgi:hypothetical protein
VVTTYRGEEHHWPRRLGGAVAAKDSTSTSAGDSISARGTISARGSTSARHESRGRRPSSGFAVAVLMRVPGDLD